ncbi:MAG: hypothetical protein OXB84_05945 [Halobacteriovoraceae bacterium]|nr:hypothetical protein [Halobacteriovoraceae bacterium]
MSKDIAKNELYHAVKTLVNLEYTQPCIQLNQQKLFSLSSIAFQYILYRSTKIPGAYIIRIEDAYLADKLGRKAKDASTRKFIRHLLLPRKLQYHKSIFYLDFFHMSSWTFTNDIPKTKNKLQGALIIKNTFDTLMKENGHFNDKESDASVEKDFYLTSLQKITPKTIVLNTKPLPCNAHQVQFPFLKEPEKNLLGVTISDNTDLTDEG